MDFEYLDSESENLLKELLGYDTFPNQTFRGYTIDYLVKHGFVVGRLVTTLSDEGPCYMVTAATQKGKAYFEMKKRYEKEKRRLTRREWMIAIVSATVGAFIGLIPSFVNWIA